MDQIHILWLVSFTFFNCFLFMLLWTNSSDEREVKPRKDFLEQHAKYILTWSSAYQDSFYGVEGGFKAFEKCPSRCYITNNRSYFGKNREFKFDAIMFHQRSLSRRDLPDRRRRRPEQSYVHWSFESPAFSFHDLTDLKYLSRFFNYSMSYRLDSDFPTPYGVIEKVKEHPTGQTLDKLIKDFGIKNHHLYSKVVKSVNSSVAVWLVSNCLTKNVKSKRDVLVKKLQKFIGVDVFGKYPCSNNSCPGTTNTQCLDQLNKTYLVKAILSIHTQLYIFFPVLSFPGKQFVPRLHH